MIPAHVIIPPATEPVTLSEALTHLRMDSGERDDELSALITAARQYVELVTGRALVSQQLEMSLDSWPDHIPLRVGPVQSVTEIRYIDPGGEEHLLSESIYRLTGRERLRVVTAYGQQWPALLCDVDTVTVRWLAGYGSDGSAVPASLRHAILLLVGHWFENKEAITFGPGTPLPLGVESLLAPHRCMELG